MTRAALTLVAERDDGVFIFRHPEDGTFWVERPKPRPAPKLGPYGSLEVAIMAADLHHDAPTYPYRR